MALLTQRKSYCAVWHTRKSASIPVRKRTNGRMRARRVRIDEGMKEDSQLVHIQDSQLIHIQDLVLTPVEKKNSESQLDHGTQEFVETEVDNRDKTKETIRPLRETTNFKQSGVKCKLPFSNGHRSTSMDDSAKERNEVLVNCLREEHHIKMKNMAEAHNFATEEHKLRMHQMTEHHNLLKEEYNLRLEKLKLEILLLKSKGTIKE
ncbi:hypothetical protein ACJJTC_010531 [Scirpophaga incertulas]